MGAGGAHGVSFWLIFPARLSLEAWILACFRQVQLAMFSTMQCGVCVCVMDGWPDPVTSDFCACLLPARTPHQTRPQLARACHLAVSILLGHHNRPPQNPKRGGQGPYSLASVTRSEPKVAKPSGAAQPMSKLRSLRVPRSGPVNGNSDASKPFESGANS